MSIGGKQIAVFEADAPTGPWRDPLGDFLLANGSSLSPPTSPLDRPAPILRGRLHLISRSLAPRHDS